MVGELFDFYLFSFFFFFFFEVGILYVILAVCDMLWLSVACCVLAF